MLRKEEIIQWAEQEFNLQAYYYEKNDIGLYAKLSIAEHEGSFIKFFVLIYGDVVQLVSPKEDVMKYAGKDGCVVTKTSKKEPCVGIGLDFCDISMDEIQESIRAAYKKAEMKRARNNKRRNKKLRN